MSIIAYYIHVDGGQLQALREEPALVWDINSNPRFTKAALFDIDKDYEVLAWLLSEGKRKEQAQQVARYRAIDRERESGSDYSKTEFNRVVGEELEKLGVRLDDLDASAADPLLDAIEGRGSESQRDPKIDFGLGSARLFSPDEVKALAKALESVTDADVRTAFNRTEMAKFDVGGMGWLEEEDSVIDLFLIPAFRRLQAFYSNAASLGHHVLVIYQ